MKSNPKAFGEWLSAATAGLERNIRQRLELELSAHYEDAYQEFLDGGLSPEEAARKALEKLGDPEASRELFRDEYAVEMPWQQDFLPKKRQGAEYGYIKGNKLVSCTREELIEMCKGAGINSTEVTLAWTPESDQVVPVERIPFLFEAIKEKRGKSARWELLQSCMWAALLGAEFKNGGVSSLRHLTLFFGLLTVLPAVSGLKSLRAANALTPEILAKEVAETKDGFHIWSGRQTAHITLSLIVTMAIVTIMEIVAAGFGGSFENAALVKSATQSGEWWRLLTCIFAHAGLQHLFFNAIGLGVFGHLVEVGIGRMFLPIVFLLSALSGSVFSLLLNPQTSVGASGGILGLAGFLFTSAGQRKAVPLPGLRRAVATVACFAAIGGIIAYDLFDSAAHLGGLLAGLAIGWAVKDPRKFSSSRAFHLVGMASCALLALGAVLGIFLMMRPVPKPAKSAAQAVETRAEAPPQSKNTLVQELAPAPPTKRFARQLTARTGVPYADYPPAGISQQLL